MATSNRMILASASRGRRYLLERAGYRFEQMPSNVDEPTSERFPDPRLFVQHVAWLKAAAVAPRVDRGLVLAADSTSWHSRKGIGKPADEADARRILRQLSGVRHELWTGVCLWRRPDDWQVAWQEKSIVEMKPLTPEELEAIIASGVWRGNAGGYALEFNDDPFVRVVEGSVSNVIGLPMESLERVLDFIGAGVKQ